MIQYALSNLIPGKTPHVRPIEAGWSLNPGEVLYSREPLPNETWDPLTLSLRSKTTAELLVEAQETQISEIEQQGAAEMSRMLPVYRALILLARNSQDPRFATLKATDDKITQKTLEIKAKTRPEDVALVKWINQ